MNTLRSTFLLLGIFFWATAAAASDAVSSTLIYSINVDDTANVLSPEARQRLTVRLDQFHQAGTPEGTIERDDFNVHLHICTLKTTKGSSPGKTVDTLYRNWRSGGEAGNYFERQVILFVFPQERQALFVAGAEIPPSVKQAVQATEPSLSAVFTGNMESALIAVIDRLAAALHLPADYHDAPPLPGGPGPVWGKLVWGRGMRTWTMSESEEQLVLQAVVNASRDAGHPIVLVQDPELRFFSLPERAEQMARAWPDRTILLLSNSTGSDMEVVLRPADAIKLRFSRETIHRIESEVVAAAKDAELDRTLIRVIGEVGAIAAGHPVAAWIPREHPIQALLGGRDASDDKRIKLGIGTFFKLVALILLLVWIWFFIKDPRQATVGLIFIIIDLFLGSGTSQRR